MKNQKDVEVLQKLANEYMEIANLDIQNQKRDSWEKLNNLSMRRPTVLVYGMHNAWCHKLFNEISECKDPFFRNFELDLRTRIFQHEINDDFILEPWLHMGAVMDGSWGKLWGVDENHHEPEDEGGAWKFDPPVKKWSDLEKLTTVPHKIHEKATKAQFDRIHSAVGDIIPINVDRAPAYRGFMADISTSLASLRGLEQIMLDMYESPDELHKLLTFMRDGILKEQQRGEDAGDWNSTSQDNQAMPYGGGMKCPELNHESCKRDVLWTHCAAQEFTLISPEMHDEFLLQYQLPILKEFGLVSYGCCEDLTKKIDMLRQISNLRQIAVAPWADLKKCVEQIGTDYVISWRPNPTDMVCADFNENRIRKIIKEGLEILKGTHFHICLKDIETIQGNPDRLRKWVTIVDDEIDKVF